MRPLLVIALTVLISGCLSQPDVDDGSGASADEAKNLVNQYIEAALDDSAGVQQQDVDARDLGAGPSPDNPGESDFEGNEETRSLGDNPDADFEENAEANEDVQARGFEDAWNEEDLDEEPQQENIEEARSIEEPVPENLEEARSADDEPPETFDERSVDDNMEATSNEDDLEARALQEDVEPPLDEDMDLEEEEDLEARDLEGADGDVPEEALETADDDNEQISKRSTLGLARIVSRQIGWRNASRLLNYGCYCGFRPWRRWTNKKDKKRRTPVDAIDKCCLARRACYARGTRGSYWTRQCKYSFRIQRFRYQCKGSKCTCLSNPKSCAGKACKCVTDFASCIKNNWDSYNPKNRRNCK